MMENCKIGILGMGHLGRIHFNCLKDTPFEIVGFFDPDPKVAEMMGKDIVRFNSPEDLLTEVDAVDIVSPTTTHFQLIKKALEREKHVFVEKPVCFHPNEAVEIEQFKDKSLVLQVGHVERFNPAFIPIKNKGLRPMFIEGHRIAEFNPRGTDVSVVLDLMIHDLDIVLALVNSEVQHISASGVSLVSDSPDIANARIEFENGCVANLTASRISMKQMRKLRIFANNAYVSMDFLQKELSIINLENEKEGTEIQSGYELETPKGKKYVTIHSPEIHSNNAIQEELMAFYKSITEGAPVEAGITEGRKALELAFQIIEQIKTKESRFKEHIG